MKTTERPTLQNFHIEGVKHIVPSDAHQAIVKGEAVLIDVRELSEVRLEKIPLDRVLNHPMSVITDRLPYISKDQHIILICQGGVRSVKVANLLNRQGYPDVANLEGGISLWKAQGLPIESNIPVGGCGCTPVFPKTGFKML
ncbi:MAG: rhodanese-like domain-containing protein [Bacteroidia bacterium]|nr:rhodanese-like domain-containing protein [Bacteroidia bacterium]